MGPTRTKELQDMQQSTKYAELQRSHKVDQLGTKLATAVLALRKSAAIDDFFLSGAREKAAIQQTALRDRFIHAANEIDPQWPHRPNLRAVDEMLNDLDAAEWTMTPTRPGQKTAASPFFYGFWLLFIASWIAIFFAPLNDMPPVSVLLLFVFPLLGIAFLPSVAFRWLIRRKFDQRLAAVYEAVDEIAAFALNENQEIEKV
jgi:hypothetical protein